MPTPQYPHVYTSFGPILIRKFNATSSVTLRHEKERETRPISGARATVEQGEALQSRITATRILLTGVFALAWRKKSGGESWLTIEGNGFFWVEQVPRGKAVEARQFAARVNSFAASGGR